MKPVKTLQKYKCDFCKRRSIKSAMELHEKRCFRNPDRLCDYCKNKGYTTECHGDLVNEGDCGLSEDVPCPYCSKRDPEMEKGIAEYEAKIETTEEQNSVTDVPF